MLLYCLCCLLIKCNKSLKKIVFIVKNNTQNLGGGGGGFPSGGDKILGNYPPGGRISCYTSTSII